MYYDIAVTAKYCFPYTENKSDSSVHESLVHHTRTSNEYEEIEHDDVTFNRIVESTNTTENTTHCSSNLNSM